MEWYFASVLSTIFYGIYFFMLKVAAHYKISLKFLMVIQNLCLVCLTLFFLFYYQIKPDWDGWLIFLAVANGILFMCTQIGRLQAMKYIPEGIVLPLTRASLILVCLWSWLVLDEHIGTGGIVGILLSLAMMFLLNLERKNNQAHAESWKKGLSISMFAVLCSAGCAIVLKYASITSTSYATGGLQNRLSFILLGYSFLLIIFPLYDKIDPKVIQRTASTSGEIINFRMIKTCLVGLFAGTTLFCGFYLLLIGMQGPLMVVTLLQGNAIVIPIILGHLIFKSPISFRINCAIVLAIAATVAFKFS